MKWTYLNDTLSARLSADAECERFMMRKFRKLLAAAMIATVAAMTSTVPALAQETWITTEDGASRFVTLDESGAASGYQGWYQDPNSGSFYYFEDGALATGWIIDDGKFYYLDSSTGAMAVNRMVGNFYVGEDGAAMSDTTTPDGVKLAYNGSRMNGKDPVEELNEKTYTYRELLRKNPNLIAEFSDRTGGTGHQILRETARGFTWVIYATMKLYEPTEDGQKGKRVFEGDGAFRFDALIERKQSDGSIRYIRPFGLIQDDRQQWTAAHIQIDPAGFVSYASDEG